MDADPPRFHYPQVVLHGLAVYLGKEIAHKILQQLEAWISWNAEHNDPRALQGRESQDVRKSRSSVTRHLRSVRQVS
jgi:hypothetical protein